MSELLLRDRRLGAGHARVGGLAVPPLRRALGRVRVGDRRRRDRARAALRHAAASSRRTAAGSSAAARASSTGCRGRSTSRATPPTASTADGEVAICGARCEHPARSPSSSGRRTSRSRCAAPATRRGRSTTSSSRSSRPSGCSWSRSSRPSGNWSSYPPHKHDEDKPPGEVVLEETYYFRTAKPEAFAVQRLYSPRHGLDVTETVRDGDLMLVPYGYHTTAAAHGYDLYYLNALAGDRRSMAAADDPDLAWIRAAWDGLEPDPARPARPVIRVANAPVSYGAFELTVGVLPNVPGPDEVLDAIAAAGYEGTELGPIGYLGRGNELRSRLRSRGLALAGAFVELRFGDGDFSRARGDARPARGLRREAGALPTRARATATSISTSVERAVELARARGFEPTFHHHMRTRVQTPAEIERLLEGTSVGLLLDTGHLTAGGGDPVQRPARLARPHRSPAREGRAARRAPRRGRLGRRVAWGSLLRARHRRRRPGGVLRRARAATTAGSSSSRTGCRGRRTSSTSRRRPRPGTGAG